MVDDQVESGIATPNAYRQVRYTMDSYPYNQWLIQNFHLRGVDPNRWLGFGFGPMIFTWVFGSGRRIFICDLEVDPGPMRATAPTKLYICGYIPAYNNLHILFLFWKPCTITIICILCTWLQTISLCTQNG